MLTAKSKTAMSKIKIVVDENSNRFATELPLDHLEREYQHVEIRNIYFSTLESQMLIDSVSSSVRTIRTSWDFPMRYELPCVEEIFLLGKSMCDSYIDLENQGIIPMSRNLKKLVIWGKVKDPLLLSFFLQGLGELENIVFEYCDDVVARCILSLHDFMPIHLQLHTLHIGLSICTDAMMDKLSTVLLNQRYFLCDVKFRSPQKLFIWTLKNLPHLERITYAQSSRDVQHVHKQQIETNFNLKEANFVCASNNLISHFVDAHPTLDKIYVSSINKHLMKIITNKAVGVKVLRFAMTDDDSTLESLKELYGVMRTNSELVREDMEIIQI